MGLALSGTLSKLNREIVTAGVAVEVNIAGSGRATRTRMTFGYCSSGEALQGVRPSLA